MKRILAISLALLAAAAFIFGAVLIYKSIETGKDATVEYQLGMGTVASASAKGSDSAKSTVTTAAVITDADGKIVSCVLDCGDFSISYDDAKAGTSGAYLTKNELGDSYNMVTYGGAIAEWYKQAESFCEYVKGLDLEAVKALKLDDSTKATDADLLAGCTIAIGDFKEALVKALEDKGAVKFESDKAPELSFAMMNADTLGAEGEDGTVSVKMTTSLFAAATLEGKVLAAVTDVADAELAYGKDGKVAKSEFKGTKRELGDDYNMVTYGGAKHEWYVQAENFCKFIVGKTASEVASIKMDDAGKAQDADLVAGCTIAIGDLIKVAEKALKA